MHASVAARSRARRRSRTTWLKEMTSAMLREPRAAAGDPRTGFRPSPDGRGFDRRHRAGMRRCAALRKPLDLAGDAVQDAHLVILEPATPEHAAQCEHDVLWVLWMEEADAQQRPLQVLEHALDRCARRWRDRSQRRLRATRDAAQVVADEQDGLREVERRVDRTGVEGDQALAVAQVVVGEPVIFGTEQNADGALRSRGEDGRSDPLDVFGVTPITT